MIKHTALRCFLGFFLFLFSFCAPFKKDTFDPNDVNLILYTPDGKSNRIILGDESTLVNFQKDKGVKAIAHGFTATGYASWILEMKDIFIRLDYNVIAIDWGKLSAEPYYETAKANTIPVGKHVADVIVWICKKYDKSTDDFHVIGHSLGAHLVGIIGYNMPVPGMIGRVTGLDAALPKYHSEPLESRLDPSDGIFVDVIHTNGGTLLDGAMGFIDPIGHVDFYPNGGKHQPGCATYRKWDLIPDLIPYFFERSEVACSHSRATAYFTESILNPYAFSSNKCTNYKDYELGLCFDTERGTMGFHASKETRGSFYLATRPIAPFHGIEYQIRIYIDPEQESTYGKFLAEIHTYDMIDGTVVHDGSITGNQTLNKVIAILPDMTTVHEIEIKYFAVGSTYPQTVAIKKVDLFNPLTGKRYCMENIVIEDGVSFVAPVHEC